MTKGADGLTMGSDAVSATEGLREGSEVIGFAVGLLEGFFDGVSDG
jgi:hypothetical protein